jgi:hypothetical protein
LFLLFLFLFHPSFLFEIVIKPKSLAFPMLATLILNRFYLILSLSLWQAAVSKRHQCQYSGVAIISTMAAIQAVIFALCLHRTDQSKWRLGWNARLLASNCFNNSFFKLWKCFTALKSTVFLNIYSQQVYI